jgi:hypothetical protein
MNILIKSTIPLLMFSIITSLIAVLFIDDFRFWESVLVLFVYLNLANVALSIFEFITGKKL